jgi:hypothetical protein
VKDARSEAPAKAIGLSEHLVFFDADEDHKISVFETMQGLERLGFGHLLSMPSAVTINLSVAMLGLVQGKVLNPNRLALPTTGFVRHGDTELVDDQGYFDDGALRAAFSHFGQQHAGQALTVSELAAMVTTRLVASSSGNLVKQLGLPLGLGAVAVEWGTLLWLAGTRRDGELVLELEAVRRFYTDPQFFHELAARLTAERSERARTLRGKARNLVQSWLI